jgi:hypothetical protein
MLEYFAQGIATVLLVVKLMLQAPALAATPEPMTFRIEKNVIVAEGTILPETADEFRALLKAKGWMGKRTNKLVLLRSTGGALEAALELGRLIRQHHMSVAAFGNCYSACTYMLMGGEHRVITRGTRFGMHQFYNLEALQRPDEKFYSARDLIEKQKLIARLSEYVDEMGVDQAVIALASKTAPDRVSLLSRRQLIAYRIENVATREAEGQRLEALVIPGVTQGKEVRLQVGPRT